MQRLLDTGCPHDLALRIFVSGLGALAAAGLPGKAAHGEHDAEQPQTPRTASAVRWCSMPPRCATSPPVKTVDQRLER